MKRSLKISLCAVGALIAVAYSLTLRTPPIQSAYEILETKDHDATLFTQGLIVDGQDLIESAGRYGQSRNVRYNAETGEKSHSAPLPRTVFAEDIHQRDQSIFLLTWREKRA